MEDVCCLAFFLQELRESPPAASPMYLFVSWLDAISASGRSLPPDHGRRLDMLQSMATGLQASGWARVLRCRRRRVRDLQIRESSGWVSPPAAS